MPTRTNIMRRVPESVCLECHTPDHSDDFVYDTKLRHVMHRSDVAVLSVHARAAR
jgi:hypothetical protein